MLHRALKSRFTTLGYIKNAKLATLAVEKEQLCIGTIGHFEHGKTTLTSAITQLLLKKGT